jgi:hypothetical protein
MSLYEGYKCAACGNVFNDNDDVVVCPECGAPHHRSCYFEKGACALAEKHSEDFKYTPEKPEELKQEKPFEEAPKDFTPPKPEAEPTFTKIPPEVFLYGGVNPDDKIAGIPAKELAEYVGPSSGSFLRKWKMKEQGFVFSFNIPAFLLGPVYFLYRKMWLLGIVYLILTLVASTPATIMVLFEQLGISGEVTGLENISLVFSYILFAVKF